jgi:flagellar basal body-associated protein FliL
MNTVIAVLSTIILAVTILTLLLGIFAYIVYKTRKRAPKQRVQPEKPAEAIKEPEPAPEEKIEVPTSSPPAEEAPSLIRRYEPEKKKEKKAEWR